MCSLFSSPSSSSTDRVIVTSNPNFSVVIVDLAIFSFVTAPLIIAAVMLYPPVFELALPLMSPPVKENVLALFKLVAVVALPLKLPQNVVADTRVAVSSLVVNLSDIRCEVSSDSSTFRTSVVFKCNKDCAGTDVPSPSICKVYTSPSVPKISVIFLDSLPNIIP